MNVWCSECESSPQAEVHPFFKDSYGRFIVLYSYHAQDENDLSVERGQCVTLLNKVRSTKSSQSMSVAQIKADKGLFSEFRVINVKTAILCNTSCPCFPVSTCRAEQLSLHYFTINRLQKPSGGRVQCNALIAMMYLPIFRAQTLISADSFQYVES